jgi:hypothetical protein
MTNANKAKGDRAEAAVRDYLRVNGFPGTERTRAGYQRDAGDLHLTPGLIAQVKDVAAYSWPTWLASLEGQIAEAQADHGVLVSKRRGLGDAGNWLAVMPLSAWVRLAREAGYGTGIES